MYRHSIRPRPPSVSTGIRVEWSNDESKQKNSTTLPRALALLTGGGGSDMVRIFGSQRGSAVDQNVAAVATRRRAPTILDFRLRNAVAPSAIGWPGTMRRDAMQMLRNAVQMLRNAVQCLPVPSI